MRIDMHVHSRFSKRPSQWILQKINCPESFTEPLQIYKTAMDRAMTHVTITDHNTIDGALSIAHLPNTFVSEEITTYFPEDGCKVHVLAYHVTEQHHAEIQKVRQNIYDLVAYLNAEGIFHVAAHPLYSINDKLTMWHVERILLLFKNLEMNGARHFRENRCLRQVVRHLTPERMKRLAEKHRILPGGKAPWEKRLFGGSDDHSSLNIARTFTEMPDATDPVSALQAEHLPERIRVVSRPATPRTMAHNLYSIAYQFYRDKFQLQSYASRDELLGFLDRSLCLPHDGHQGLMSRICLFLSSHRKSRKNGIRVSDSVLDLLRKETRKILRDHPDLFAHGAGGEQAPFKMENHWFTCVNTVSNRIIRHFCDRLIGQISGANLLKLFQTLGSAGSVYALVSPYFVAFSEYAKDRRLSEDVFRQLGPGEKPGKQPDPEPRVAHFTDTFYEVNGVAHTLRQQVESAKRCGRKLTVITCSDAGQALEEPVRNFAPVGTYTLPEYPEQKIFYPPFLEMLDYMFRNRFTHIQSATPGPIGLAAIAIARILKLPICGTYHTAIPQYAQILTGDGTIEALSWRYMLWYYDQMDVVYVPSESTRKELVEKGLRAGKIRLYPRGIDIERFHPAKRNGVFNKQIPIPEGVRLLYVGRVSKEKNLDLLIEAFRNLVRRHPEAHLVVVGDGPYMEDLKRLSAGLPCRFTGYLEGETLSTVYASSDLFVFPSTTDTFGNVVLEAQASGLPVVITGEGGPCENILAGETGLIFKGDDCQSLTDVLDGLLSNPERMRAMGRAARLYAETRSFDAAFARHWECYRNDFNVREPQAA